MSQRTLSVGIVLCEGDKVLLVKHTEKAKLPTGSFGFPAGRVNKGETPEMAAIREFEEETGLITSQEYLHKIPERRSTLRMKEGFEDFTFQPFICTKHWGQLKSSEKTIPEFVELDRLAELNLITDDVAEIARKYHKTSFP